MEYFTLVRVIHVLAVVLWIGGVAMVTTVIIPSIKKLSDPKKRYETFEAIEHTFALQAKITTTITGISGFYMLYVLDAWDRYTQIQFWWIHAMTFVWFLFTMVLFVLEPFILHKLFEKYSISHPQKTFVILQQFHWVLLTLSLITIAGAVAGSHGWHWI